MADLKYTPELVDQICSFIKQGLSNKDAISAICISESTFYYWKSIYPEFSESIKKAEVERKATLLKRIFDASNTSWQAAAWYLERVYPNEFGKREKIEVESKKDKEYDLLKVLMPYFSEEERQVVIRALDRFIKEAEIKNTSNSKISTV